MEEGAPEVRNSPRGFPRKGEGQQKEIWMRTCVKHALDFMSEL